MRVHSHVPAAGSGLSPDDGCGPLHGKTWRSSLAGWTWSVGGALCPRSIPSPGGDSHFPWVEVCADTGLGLIREQKVQGAEAAVTKAGQGLSPPEWLLSSTQIKVEQQLVEEDPFPMSRSEGPVSHTTEGQGRPEVSVATWASGEPGPVDGWRRTPPPKPSRPNMPTTSKPLSPNMQMAIFNSMLKYYASVNDTRLEDLEPKEAEPKAPAQEAAPPVTPEVHPEETDAELEAPPPPELPPPPAASPAAAVEPGPAPDETEAPPPLEEEPSLEPMLVPASEEELLAEEPVQGPLVKWAHPVPREKLVIPPLLDLFRFFYFFILFLCSPWLNDKDVLNDF
ncbi:hypothetical protein QTO34_005608 [Cnephaeus nilssonii]|uniref:Uncharacterized protein n=1 Tax=Cnephaeus nilssonii TaxID=3371016 RepID=A0AA40HNT3_CNENI|nr:hypothetical protein QTO34_005608 [Eptesicus nilssonii]